MMEAHFSHSGDLGDIIFSLPAIKALGGGVLALYDCCPERTVHPMTPERVETIRSLLLSQPYIHDVVFDPHGQDHPLNRFRNVSQEFNLAERHLIAVGLPRTLCCAPWLKIKSPNKVAPILFARSLRYRNPDFPWKEVHQKYKHGAVFVGLPDEHEDFCTQIGPINFYPTRNLFELARVIAGSRLIIANQSAPAAIAEGMKHSMVLEVSKYLCETSCVFQRKNLTLGYGRDVILPEVILGSFGGNRLSELNRVWRGVLERYS